MCQHLIIPFLRIELIFFFFVNKEFSRKSQIDIRYQISKVICQRIVFMKKVTRIVFSSLERHYLSFAFYYFLAPGSSDVPMDTTSDTVPMETESSNNGSGVTITGWTCPHCTFINKSAVSNVCDMCGLPRN